MHAQGIKKMGVEDDSFSSERNFLLQMMFKSGLKNEYEVRLT